MTPVHAVRAELRKALGLPATLVALGLAAAGSIGLTALSSSYARAALAGDRDFTGFDTSPLAVAMSAVPLGVVGAVVLGVVVVSSEYTTNRPDAGGGRQITATLGAVPRRAHLLVAKVAAVVLLVAPAAVLTVGGCTALAHLLIGPGAPPVDLADAALRVLAAAAYWTMTGLLALAVTVLTRSGVVPLVVFIANSSVVSVSFLLSRVTSFARFLPDLAGARLVSDDTSLAVERALSPLTGGLVMLAWVLALLAVAAVALTRRDA